MPGHHNLVACHCVEDIGYITGIIGDQRFATGVFANTLFGRTFDFNCRAKDTIDASLNQAGVFGQATLFLELAFSIGTQGEQHILRDRIADFNSVSAIRFTKNVELATISFGAPGSFFQGRTIGIKFNVTSASGRGTGVLQRCVRLIAP